MKINFVAILKGLGVKMFASLAGWQAWLINIVLQKVWKAISEAFNKFLVYLNTSKEVKKQLDEYKKTINNPDATAEEIKDAGKGFLED